jgi:hypothetical protein
MTQHCLTGLPRGPIPSSWCLAAAALCLLFLPPRPALAQTLGEVLSQNGQRTPAGLVGRDSWPITSYATRSDSTGFAITYYRRDGELLGDTLFVSLRDEKSGGWTHAEVLRVRTTTADSTSYILGSATRITLGPEYIYVDTHLTPSAGTLLVLTRSLLPVVMVKGWSELVLPDGSMVYQKNLVHFAATHPAELRFFDPRGKRDLAVYPSLPYAEVRRSYIERVREMWSRLGDDWFRLNNHHQMAEQFESRIGTPVADSTGGRIAFLAWFGDGGGSRAATPLLEVLVVCSNIALAAQCSELELSATRIANPGWSDERILREALSRGG